MWISEPMPVTTRIISADSGSRRSVKPTLEVAGRDPGEDRLHDRARFRRQRRPAATPTAADTANEASIAPQAIAPAAPLLIRRPRPAFSRKPTNGRSGISSSMQQMQPRRHEDTKTVIFVPSCFVAIVLTISTLVNESGLSDSRCRNSAMTIARPTAASAAATVITKNTMICPSTEPRARPKATNVRFTAFSMISIDSRIVIRLRRTNTPAVPIVNRIADSSEVVVQASASWDVGGRLPAAARVTARDGPAPPRRPSPRESGSR